MDRRPDVIVVVLDTARRDRFGCYGYDRDTTPTVDRLASEGMRADRMITNGPYTLPSHASLFTGLYPSQHGSQWRTGPRLRQSVTVTMAEWFKSIGYETVCATNNGLIGPRTHLSRGFDRYAFRLDLEQGIKRTTRRAKKALIGGESGGKITNSWVKRELPKVRKPLFLFVNFLECHWSYVPSPTARHKVGGPSFRPFEGLHYRLRVADRVGPWEAIARADRRKLDIYSSLYDGELATADGHLRELLGILKDAGRMEEGNTVTIVTSDHGEHLGEHGLADHHGSLDSYLTHVPFVAWGPQIIDRGVRNDVYEFVDVFPSLVNLLGEKLPASYLDTRRTDLFGPLDEEDHREARSARSEDLAFAEWRCWHEREMGRLARRNPSFDFVPLANDLLSVQDHRFKLVRSSSGSSELYDLEGADPEEVDVSHEHPEVVQRLDSALDERVNEWLAWEKAPEPLSAEDEAEIEKQLSALGYI